MLAPALARAMATLAAAVAVMQQAWRDSLMLQQAPGLRQWGEKGVPGWFQSRSRGRCTESRTQGGLAVGSQWHCHPSPQQRAVPPLQPTRPWPWFRRGGRGPMAHAPATGGCT